MNGYTPAQKRAYAIKKSMERRGKKAPRFEQKTENLTPLEGYEIHPHLHRCGPYDIEYGPTQSTCTVCGRLSKLEKGAYREVHGNTTWVQGGPASKTLSFRVYPWTHKMPNSE